MVDPEVISPHLRTLQNLRDVWLPLLDSGTVNDLAFLRDAPPTTTLLQVHVVGPVDLSPLANCPTLTLVSMIGGRVDTGLEILAALPELMHLYIHPPDGGRNLGGFNRLWRHSAPRSAHVRALAARPAQWQRRLQRSGSARTYGPRCRHT